MVGDKDTRRPIFFCDIPFMKEQISNQEKGNFLSYFKAGRPVTMRPLGFGLST